MDDTQRDYAAWGAVLLAFVLGLYVRLWPGLNSDFPLNDGGLFYLMARELQAAHYRLPLYTAYNAAHIPFAYPPLGFYAAALITGVTGCKTLDVLRLFPPLCSACTIPACYLFSRALIARRSAVLATFAFALLPSTYVTMIMGGGLTRAPGFVFALLTLHQVALLYTRRQRWSVLTSALLASLTILTHPALTWFAIYSTALLWLCYGRSRRGLLDSLLVLALIATFTAPWWVTVISRYGLEPVLMASQSGNADWYSWTPLLVFNFTRESFLPLFAVLGLLGLFVCLARRQWFLPCWLISMFALQPGRGITYSMVPLALMAGMALDSLVLPGLQGVARAVSAPVSSEQSLPPAKGVIRSLRLDPMALLFLGYLLLYEVVSTLGFSMTAIIFRPLARPERQAMQWVAQHTERPSTFLILPTTWFGEDRTSEWFPALAQRVSVMTVQGSEWLPHREFFKRRDNFNKLMACRNKDISSLEKWAREAHVHYTHLYISKLAPGEAYSTTPVTWRLAEQSLRRSGRYQVIYDGPGAVIFRRVD